MPNSEISRFRTHRDKFLPLLDVSITFSNSLIFTSIMNIKARTPVDHSKMYFSATMPDKVLPRKAPNGKEAQYKETITFWTDWGRTPPDFAWKWYHCADENSNDYEAYFDKCQEIKTSYYNERNMWFLKIVWATRCTKSANGYKYVFGHNLAFSNPLIMGESSLEAFY